MTRFSPMVGGDPSFCNEIASQLQPCGAVSKLSYWEPSDVIGRWEVYHA